MSNTEEAAQMIEDRIVDMETILKQQLQLRDKMAEQGEDIVNMDRIVGAAEDVIETHKESVRIIRASLEETS